MSIVFNADEIFEIAEQIEHGAKFYRKQPASCRLSTGNAAGTGGYGGRARKDLSRCAEPAAKKRTRYGRDETASIFGQWPIFMEQKAGPLEN